MSALRSRKIDEFTDQAAAWEAGGAQGIFIPRAKSNDTFVHTDERVAFPAVEAKVQPLGSRVLVQIMLPIMRSASGLVTSDESQAIDHDNMQVAKVIAVGPLAFCQRTTGEAWPEGAWCGVGDFVRIPKYPKDVVLREVQVQDFTIDPATDRRIEHLRPARVRLALIQDLDIIARYENSEAAITERAVG